MSCSFRLTEICASKVLPEIAAGSWQEWGDWKTSESSWCEYVWNETLDKIKGAKTEFERK